MFYKLRGVEGYIFFLSFLPVSPPKVLSEHEGRERQHLYLSEGFSAQSMGWIQKGK